MAVSADRIPNQTLRAVRRALNLSQDEFAERLREAGRRLGEPNEANKRLIQRWETGVSNSARPVYRRALELVTGRPYASLGFTDRAPSVGSALAVGRLDQLRRALAASVSDGALSSIAIDDLEQTVVRYGLLSRDRPAPLLLADLTADLAEVYALMDRPRPLSSTYALTRVAANMCGLVCLTLIKLDRRPEFRSWARVARTTARETGDPETISWVLAQECYGHYYAQDFDEALLVARGAQHVAGTVPRVGAVLAAALEARILAARGDRPGCEHAIGRAETGLGQLPAGSVNDSAFGYDEGQLRFHQGNAYTHLGDTRKAWPAQQRALDLCGPADYMDRAFTRLDRAACLIRDGDAEDGLAYALDAMNDLNDHQRAGIIALRGRQLLAGLPESRRRALPVAGELDDRLMTPDDEEQP
ncbi:hypothetical protein KDL01_04320 [Actinospica durhamensis]|uniref:XRE family transcriptional regulator n=1 Tax=Actinospica durhamensis TaxID=1508375 RepID=A0A941IQ10_9ACTN|nr:hypothetical protein [Actinospica durhamensis]MBR7832468.1 hypothetical protein [Actinospica durhamensis]